jgi:hypothetical protein
MTAVQPEAFATPADPERLDRAASGLRERGLSVSVVDDAEQARKAVIELLPTDATVFTARSETLRLTGIAVEVDESGRYRSVRRMLSEEGNANFRTQVRLSAAPDVVLGSVHAVTDDGVMVVGSASGSQLGPYAAGAASAIWVVGAQKVVPDVETALRRLRTYSLPLESERLRPTYAQGSFIGRILIMEREALPGRGTVILVREALGY